MQGVLVGVSIGAVRLSCFSGTCFPAVCCRGRVVSMRLYVFLKILGALKVLLAKVALVRFQWDVDPNVRRNVISFHCDDPAVLPSARQGQVVG